MKKTIFTLDDPQSLLNSYYHDEESKPPQNQQGQNITPSWPPPFAYAPFGQPPPFGFMQAPPPAFYGGFPPQVMQTPGFSVSPITGPGPQVAHRRQSPPPGPGDTGTSRLSWTTESSRMDVDDTGMSSSNQSRATHQELDREMDQEDRKRRHAEEQDTEHACLHAEHAPIPPQVMEMQRRELDMAHPEMAGALRDQISMNIELL
ncbi:hypothetical protein ARMGADRAFT_1027058 [Armillaria gallica]|uniref:Uncharacterized protein n=1 Tax=Armillaria gallica TaxID=47427 RepID=A0A2H3EDF9_ARMGA|nr:hypothetical protein ARMGADRAFT_1027058 [Armillaria gallica]